MRKVIVFGLLLISGVCLGQNRERALKYVSLSGDGYELGKQHGQMLKTEIADVISAWKQNTYNELKRDPDGVINDFFQYAKFENAIKKWTPDLYEEVRGIADGSGQDFKYIMVLNLLDEFWVYVNNLNNHHCSAIGVPASKGKPGYVSQNMDLETYTDGFQVLMRLEKTNGRPEQLILTHPGLIGLNGINDEGVAVCVNTLMQLQAAPSGLPVAFVIRRLINSTKKEDILNFVQHVNHASGQNYIIGIKGEVYDFEASANKVVRYNPSNKNGIVYHTNHPIANDDIKPWFRETDAKRSDTPKKSNSHYRFSALESRLAITSNISSDLIKETLRSKDNPDNPVCRTNNSRGGFTFASVIMTMAKDPFLMITAGPPDESEYQRFDFKTRH